MPVDFFAVDPSAPFGAPSPLTGPVPEDDNDFSALGALGAPFLPFGDVTEGGADDVGSDVGEGVVGPWLFCAFPFGDLPIVFFGSADFGKAAADANVTFEAEAAVSAFSG
jgi:hypothetical protein